MESVRPELLRVGGSEQVRWQDERAEGVVCRGGEDGGAIRGPLSAFEVVAFILGSGPLCRAQACFRIFAQECSFLEGCFGYAALVEVCCSAYESRLGRVVFVRGGRHFPSV